MMEITSQWVVEIAEWIGAEKSKQHATLPNQANKNWPDSRRSKGTNGREKKMKSPGWEKRLKGLDQKAKSLLNVSASLATRKGITST